MQVSSSFLLLDQFTVSWEIHALPVKMGSETCSDFELGSCLECNQVISSPNSPTETQPVCIRGQKLGPPDDLAPCAQINELIGRSIVVTVRHNSQEKVYCATIYRESDQNPNFTSTIAWFDSPLTGFVAFRKESPAVSYIIVNLTRTVDNNNRVDKFEILKWEIREGNDVQSRKSLYNPDRIDVEDSNYNEICDPSSDTGHQSCAVGDLWKKHGRLKLQNEAQINLMMFIDNNLDSVTLSKDKHLVIIRGDTEEVVASGLIENLEPIATDVSFMDGSVLKLLQRDDWSPIIQRYVPAYKNNAGKWIVTIYNLPPIQIFGGDQWDCDEILNKGWTSCSSQILQPFKVCFL